MKYFNNPVSMRVTEEQFESDLRNPLEELGAKFGDVRGFDTYPILVSNSLGRKATIENGVEGIKNKYNRHFIETYDPEQFLAICKLEVEMKVGECYTVKFNDCRKMIGYLLENNIENKGKYLYGKFKGLDDKNNFYKKDVWCYSTSDRTIRLSTPEEKAKLDKVIAEHENNNSLTIESGFEQIEVKDEIIISEPLEKENLNYKKSCDLWLKTQKLAIKQIELQLKNSKNNIKLEKESIKLSKKQLKHEKKILTEFLKNLENGI